MKKPHKPKRMFAMIEVETTPCSSWGRRDLKLCIESKLGMVRAIRLLQVQVNVAKSGK